MKNRSVSEFCINNENNTEVDRIIYPIKIKSEYILKKLGLFEIYDVQITCFNDYYIDNETYIYGN